MAQLARSHDHAAEAAPLSVSLPVVPQVIAVGDMFDGMSRVKKQQAIYAPLMDKIATNEIHALSIKAYTDAEWKRERKFQLPS